MTLDEIKTIAQQKSAEWGQQASYACTAFNESAAAITLDLLEWGSKYPAATKMFPGLGKTFAVMGTVTTIATTINDVYVPDLELYVAEKILTIDDRVRKAAEVFINIYPNEGGQYLTYITWQEAKRLLKNLGSRMLTPAEFWVFYDFCLVKKLI